MSKGITKVITIETKGLARELKWFAKNANYLQDSTIERDAGLGMTTLYKWKSGKVKRLSAENEQKLIEWVKKHRKL